jgi:hypothetical protein
MIETEAFREWDAKLLKESSLLGCGRSDEA